MKTGAKGGGGGSMAQPCIRPCMLIFAAYSTKLSIHNKKVNKKQKIKKSASKD